MKTTYVENMLLVDREVSKPSGEPLVEKIKDDNSYLQFRPLEEDEQKVARVVARGESSPTVSEVSSSATSMLNKANQVSMSPPFDSGIFTPPLGARSKLRRSNSWSGREQRTLFSVEEDNGKPVKPQSTRFSSGRANHGKRNKELPISQHGTLPIWAPFSQFRKKRDAEGEITLRQSNGGVERDVRNRELSVSKHKPIRSSIAKGAKSITKGTGLISKGTKKAFGIVKEKLTMSPRNEKANMELLESCAELFQKTEKPLEDLSQTQIGNVSRSSMLSRSLSLTDLMVESDSEGNGLERNEEKQLKKPVSSRDAVLARRKKRTKKHDPLSSSEHVPKKSSEHSEIRRKPRRSTRPFSPVDSPARIRRSTGSKPKDKVPVIEVDLKGKEGETLAKDPDIKKRRSRVKRDELTQSEHIPSKSKQVRRSSWGELSLTSLSDEDIDDYDDCFATEKTFNPHFSWDLSQLTRMENLLTEESEKECTKNDKLKKAFTTVKKKITGSSKKEPPSRDFSFNDSTTNVAPFDDSYQQDFVFESFGSGLGTSHRHSVSSGKTELTDPSALSGDEGRPPRSGRRLSSSGRSNVKMDRNAVMERQGSSRSLKSTNSASQCSPRIRRPPAAHQAADVATPPVTPTTPRSSSARRRRSSMGHGDTGENKKPPSWRDLYTQSPGLGSVRRTSSRVRSSSRSRKVLSRQSSVEDMAPSDIQGLPSPAKKSPPGRSSGDERECKSEEFTSPTASTGQGRPSSRRSLTNSQSSKRRSTVKPGATDLERLQW